MAPRLRANSLTIRDASFVARLERDQVNVGIVMLARLAKSLGAKLADFTVEPEAGRSRRNLSRRVASLGADWLWSKEGH